MNYKRIAFASLLGVVFLGVAVDPVAAAQYNTHIQQLTDQLNNKLLFIAIPITILVEVLLFYAAWKFRNNDEPKPTEENRRLEITWTIATAIILVFVGVASYGVMGQTTTQPNAQPQPNDLRVQVISQQWLWTFKYPESGVSSTNEMVIPANRSIYLNITSTDVIHSFHVPSMGLKQDAIPGETIPLRFTATHKGEHELYCAEYCGVGHSKMLGTIKVVSPQEYQQWLQSQQGGSTGGNSTSNNSSSISPSAAVGV